MPDFTCKLAFSVTEVKGDRRQLWRIGFFLSHRLNIDVSYSALFQSSVVRPLEGFLVFILS